MTTTIPSPALLTRLQQAARDRAAATNALTFDRSGITVDKSRNFSRSSARSASKRKIIR